MTTPTASRPRRPGGRRWLALGLVTVLVPLVACSGPSRRSHTGGPLVVVTTTQLADFARVVGGPDVQVHALLRPNLDAHDFEPSPQDMDALFRADAVVRNGLGLDLWLDDAARAAGTQAPLTDASRGAAIIRSEGGDPNPHLWFSPANAAVMVRHVLEAEVAAAPQAAPRLRARAAHYLARLEGLDTWIRAQLAPLDDRRLVTDHDAFPYYAQRYDLEIVGSIIPSFDSSAEVSPADLNDLARTIREQDVQAIFTEQSLPPKAAEALARKTGVRVVSGDDGLYGDSLGPAGSAGATYLSMMRHNTTTIVENLR